MKPGHGRILAVAAACWLGLSASAARAADDFLLGFASGTPPETTMRVAASFSFSVTNLAGSTDPISKVVIPLPAGYGGIATTPPTGWARTIGGTTITYQITKAANCGQAIAPGASLTFTLTAKPGASAADRADKVTGATAGKGSGCAGVAFPTPHDSPTWNVHGLELLSLAATPTAVAVGGQITVSAKFNNRASVKASVAASTAPPQFQGVSGSCTLVTPTQLVGANAQGTVKWTCVPTAPGTTTFTLSSLTATGQTGGTLTAAPTTLTSNSVTVFEAFSASLSATPVNALANMDVTVTMRVTNTTGMTLTGVKPKDNNPGSGAVTKVGGPTPGGNQTLAPGAFVDFVWTYHTNTGASPGAAYGFSDYAVSNEVPASNTTSLSQVVTSPPAAARAFRATGFEAGTYGADTVELYWTYVDAANTNPHTGALILTGPSASLTACQPSHGVTYARGQTPSGCAAGVTVAFSTPPDEPDTGDFGTALVASLPTGTKWFRIYQFEQNHFYTLTSGSVPNLEVTSGVGDGRLQTYSTGYTSLVKPYPSWGIGLFGGGQDAALPVYALDVDGSELWRPDPGLTWATVQAGVPPVPLGSGTALIVCDMGGAVTLLDATDGSLVWRTTPSPVLPLRGTPAAELQAYAAAPGLADDLIFASTLNCGGANYVHALNGAAGSVAWSFGNGRNDLGCIGGGMAVSYSLNRLYVGSVSRNGGPTVWALDTTTTDANGSAVWAVNVGAISTNSLSTTATAVYAPTSTGLYALDPATGTTNWSIAGEQVRGYVLPQGPAGSTALFYVAGAPTSSVVKRIDAGTSQSLSWSQPLPANVLATSVTTAGAVLHVGGSDGNIYAYSDAGALLGTRPVGGGIVSTPGVDATTNRLNVGTERGFVVSYPLPLF